MLQAKRLLAVVVGSHDTQQHELSLKEGEKVVMMEMIIMMVVVMANGNKGDTQQYRKALVW